MTPPEQIPHDSKPSSASRDGGGRKSWVTPRLKLYPIGAVTRGGPLTGTAENIVYHIS